MRQGPVSGHEIRSAVNTQVSNALSSLVEGVSSVVLAEVVIVLLDTSWNKNRRVL